MSLDMASTECFHYIYFRYYYVSYWTFSRYSLLTSPTRTRHDYLVLSASAVWTLLQTKQDSLVLSQPSFDEFCLVLVQFPIFKFPVILNIFETEQLQIANWVVTKQNYLVLSPVVFTPPTRTRQQFCLVRVGGVNKLLQLQLLLTDLIYFR